MSARVVVLDVETTGLSPKDHHRIIEIGCVELIQGEPTGNTFQAYINPQRESHPDAFKVHGLSWDFLKQYPVFSEIFSDFLDFIQQSPLIIHNAKFDMGFLNAELHRLGRDPLSNPVRDTLLLARKRFPGSPASLDALCRHFRIDLSTRTQHGALLDAQLLSHVYRELSGGLQEDLKFLASKKFQKHVPLERSRRTPRSFVLSPEEAASHQLLQEKLLRITSKK